MNRKVKHGIKSCAVPLVLVYYRKSGHSSQDSMREDSVSGTNLFSETTAISGSDRETQGHAALCPDLSDLQLETRAQQSPPTEIFVPSAINPSLIGPVGKVEKTPDLVIAEIPQIRNNGPEKKTENSSLSVSEPSGKMDLWRSACMHSRKMSADINFSVSKVPASPSSVFPES